VPLPAPVQAPSAPDADADLLKAASAGDGAACAALVERHLPRVHRLAARLLGDASEAQDVAQELFLKLWQAGSGWRRGEAQVRTWIHTVTVNLCRDRLRRLRPQAELDESIEDAATRPPEAEALRGERSAQLHQAIARLPERQREALVLFHLEGFTQAEAAAAMGVGEDALESLLARARRALRSDTLEHHGGSP